MAKKKTTTKRVKTIKAKAKSAKKSAAKKTVKKVGATSAAIAAMVGKAIPDLTLPATGGRSVRLHDLNGKNIVLYFYPKDSTPGCTIEGHDFTRLHEEFKATNSEVFGVSRDNMKSHEKFKECESYSIDLLSDEDEKACKAFGVIKMKNMYGKKVRGIERSTFVIGSDGRIVKEWRGVKVPGHAEEVLTFIKSL